MKYRITFEGENGTIYSYLDDYDEDEIKEGEWTPSFPNTEEESTAFGLIESIAQSDYCPLEYQEGEEIIKVIVKKGR